jgi:Ser/Thr protein kinase RdoA (MazF antagonist)
MIRYANLNDARNAVDNWSGDSATVRHIGDRGNSVFSFVNGEGKPQILRFTDPDFRSFDELKAELNFVNYLHASGVSVAKGIAAKNHFDAFIVKCASGDLIVSSIAYADGLEVAEGSPYWNKFFFHEWGRNLGLIHKASSLFSPGSDEPKRWHWDNELLISNAERLIPAGDFKSLQEFHEVMGLCSELPKTPSTYGLIHADHAPQNFHYDAKSGRLTAFDFGNCCYHWFLSDLAISLSTVRRKSNREEIKSNILAGYSEVRPLPHNLDKLIDLLIRLRVVYVYLSRLHLWSHNRTPEQTKELELIRSRVLERKGWN